MRLADADILIIPGLGNSGPDHWQSRWEAKIATARRVEQADWHVPKLADWVANIEAAVASASRPVILIAHSCGAAAVIHAAPLLVPGRVAGAVLVSCPDAGSPGLPGAAVAFLPVPNAPLPFPAVLVASRNDAFRAFAQAKALALDLGAAVADAGEAGHINSLSGHGPWPEGLMRLAGFLRIL